MNGDFVAKQCQSKGMDENNYVIKAKKRPIMDDYGNYVPDPDKGGQYNMMYPQAYIMEDNVKPYMEYQPEHQAYVDSVEDKIKDQQNKKASTLKPPKTLGKPNDEG